MPKDFSWVSSNDPGLIHVDESTGESTNAFAQYVQSDNTHTGQLLSPPNVYTGMSTNPYGTPNPYGMQSPFGIVPLSPVDPGVLGKQIEQAQEQANLKAKQMQQFTEAVEKVAKMQEDLDAKEEEPTRRKRVGRIKKIGRLRK